MILHNKHHSTTSSEEKTPDGIKEVSRKKKVYLLDAAGINLRGTNEGIVLVFPSESGIFLWW